MNPETFYLGTNGDIFDRRDIQRAFLITTGQDARKNQSAYLNYLDSLMGLSIEQTITPTVSWLVGAGAYDKAVYLYKRQNRCDWAEAKAAVTKLKAEREGTDLRPKS